MISKRFHIKYQEATPILKWSLSTTGEPYSLTKKKQKITVVFENNRHMNRWSLNHQHLVESVI